MAMELRIGFYVMSSNVRAWQLSCDMLTSRCLFPVPLPLEINTSALGMRCTFAGDTFAVKPSRSLVCCYNAPPCWPVNNQQRYEHTEQSVAIPLTFFFAQLDAGRSLNLLLATAMQTPFKTFSYTRIPGYSVKDLLERRCVNIGDSCLKAVLR